MTMQLFVPITKVDAARRLVYGTIAEEVPDKSGEVFDYDSSKPYFEQWSSEIARASEGKSVGNLRAMHGAIAAGKLSRLSFDDEGKRIEAIGKVVDDAEWAKVVEGVYTGFSIGGHYVERWPDGEKAELTRYTAEPTEVSLVDNPCIPSATFSVVKTDGSVERRNFKATAEMGSSSKTWAELAAPAGTTPLAKPRQIWACGVPGHAHLAKAEAVRCMERPTRDAAAEREGEAGTIQNTIEARAEGGAAVDLWATLGDLKDMLVHRAELVKRLDEREAAYTKALAEHGAQLSAAKAEHAAALTALETRLAALEAQPAEPKGRLKMIEKGQDLGKSGDTTPEIDPTDTLALIKQAQRNPKRIGFGAADHRRSRVNAAR